MRCSRAGDRVICVDNLETGSLVNIAHIRDPAFVALNVDITEPYFVDEPVDFVYHLASPASPIDYLRLPLHTLKVGSLRHPPHARAGEGPPRALPARLDLARSTATRAEHPQRETYWGHVNPIGPRGVYDEAKRYAEALTMAYHRQQGVDTAIVRIFNTYGPRMRPHDGRAIPTFMPPGARRPADHGLRRRLPDALVLLRRGSDPRADRPAGVRASRAGQHRQPRRVHAAGARRGR